MKNDPEGLKYLFTASFKDGTIIEQTPDDRSAIEPMRRSSFFDVLEHEKVSQLKRFELREIGSDPSATPAAAVNLTDGTFERKGESFQMHEENLTHAGLRIVYFRNHTRHFAAQVASQTQAPGQIGHEVVYRIGWQYQMRGRNYQQIMQID